MPGNSVIGLILATMLEAEPFIRGLSLTECEADPFPVYKNEDLHLILTGIGKANAAMACAYFIRRYHPACLCNLGAAGAAGISHRIGESYHIERIIEPDRLQLATGDPHEHIPDVLTGFPTATLATQDSPVRTPAQRKRIARQAHLADMEGASVVQACRRFHVRCYLFKFVSDTPDHDRSDDIVKNIITYRDSFFHFFRDTVISRLTSAAA